MKMILNMCMFLLLLWAAASASAEELPAKLLLPPSCGPGWKVDDRQASYGRETLSDRIDGEAELFLPYGFERLDYARYLQGEDSFDVDVYRMGSVLDAFGIYANYRPEGAEPLPTGTEGAVTSSQLFFYQGRYFVRLQSTGRSDAGKSPLAACAQAVSALLPSGEGAPKELLLVDIPEVERESIRYNATGLLGYDFFPRGITADATIAAAPARLFVLLAESPAEAAKALAAYRAYLKESGAELAATGPGGAGISGIDPLYGRVLAEQSGRYLFGLARVKESAAAARVLDRLRTRLKR